MEEVPSTSDIQETKKFIWRTEECERDTIHGIYYSFQAGKPNEQKEKAFIVFCRTPEQLFYFEHEWNASNDGLWAKKSLEESASIRTHMRKIERSIEDTCHISGLSERLVEKCSMVNCSEGKSLEVSPSDPPGQTSAEKMYEERNLDTSVGFALQLPMHDVEINRLGDVGTKLVFRAPYPMQGDFWASYAGFGVGMTLNLPQPEEDIQKYGRSDFTSFRFSYFGRETGGRIHYARHRGYFIDNSADLPAAALNGQEYYKLPELTAYEGGGEIYHIFSPESFSLPALFDVTEVQLKSAGTYLVSGTVRYSRLFSSGPFIPAAVRGNYGADGNLASLSMWGFGVGGGAAYQYVAGHFFATVLGSAGLGLQNTGYATGGEPLNNFDATVSGNGFFNIGYATSGVVVGLGGYVDIVVFETEDLHILDDVGAVRFFASIAF